jgi:hypothetical protein
LLDVWFFFFFFFGSAILKNNNMHTVDTVYSNGMMQRCKALQTSQRW